MADESKSFVFHDPSGKRWVRFRRGAQTFGVLAIVLLVLFVLSIVFVIPQLPALGLPPVAPGGNVAEVANIIRGEKAERNVPFKMRRDAKKINYVRSNSPVIHPKTAARASDGRPLVFGFYVNWDRASIVSLRLNLAHLTHLIPEWLILQNGKGDLDDQSDPTVIAIARQANLPILAELNNFRDSWRPEDVRQSIRDSDRRADLIANIYNNLEEHKFAGVNIDFEQLGVRDKEALITFMTELYAKLHPAGLIVTQSVPIEDEAYDLKRLSAVNDYLVPMVYDEHYQSGTPGPVASEQWFEDQIEKLSKIVPPERTVIGFGNYGYDWIIGASGGAEVSFSDVMAAVVANHSRIDWDADTANPVLRFGSGSTQHEIWFLDAVTALNQVQSVNDNNYRGVALWRLGAEDPNLWNVLQPEKWPEQKYDPRQLSHLTAEKAVNQYGGGEIIRIAETPRDGSRTVTAPPQPDGDYYEKYEQYPTYYVVDTSGKTDEKVICLTFDDGPDSKYTREVLDILETKKVPATFFVVGVNAEQNIDLIKREFADGDEIGNHTYSHPNIAAVSARRTELELTSTQRIIENAVGRSMTFFRPPYNADSEPQTPEEIMPIKRAQDLGYITIGESIDPRDWQPGITAEGIVKEVESENENGHIILLHDGGGDRSPTIAALPQIIDYFHARGYHFENVGALIGKTRAQTMPVPSADEMRWARFEGEAFDLKSNFKRVLGILFLTAIYLTLLRSVVYGILAIIQKIRTRKEKFDAAYRPSVSVIIAAYNEESVIVRTVQSILNNGYGPLEIIVVNDGSKDNTYQVLCDNFADNPTVRVLTQPNGGKSAALNNAIAHSQYSILIAVDADTLFQTGTIEKLTRHFADPEVGAVSGNARVGNKKKWITRFQSIEYIYGFNLDRRALDLLNAITVVPGAVGAWRKDLVEELGGFGHDTLAEDADLTLDIRREGYRVRYEQDAIAYTEAPEDTYSLAKQRFRWSFGTLQAAWKHRDAMFVPRYGTLAFIALPSIWLFQVLLATLSPFAEICMILALFAGNWKIVLLYYMAFFVLELLTGILAYSLEGVAPWDLTLLFFQRIYYRQLMHYVLAKSLLFALRGRLVGWGKIERRATVGHVG